MHYLVTRRFESKGRQLVPGDKISIPEASTWRWREKLVDQGFIVFVQGGDAQDEAFALADLSGKRPPKSAPVAPDNARMRVASKSL